MQKILIFIDWYLPGYKAGGPTRSMANLVEHLSENYYFSMVTRNTDYCETEPYSGIQPDEWTLFSKNLRVWYFSAGNLSYPNIKKLMAADNYDTIYINGTYSWYFSLLPLRLAKRFKIPVVVAPRGMLSPQTFSYGRFKKKLFYFLARHFGWYKNVTFHSTNATETGYIRQHLGKVKILEAPNLPRKASEKLSENINKKSGQLRMLMIARISEEKNNHFAVQVLTKLQGYQHMVLDLFGPAYNAEYLKQIEATINTMPPGITVTYKGALPSEKIHETMQQYHFLLFPSRGENFGHAIYEAFAAGTPVIISDQTPWRGLSQSNAGWDLPLHQPQRWQDILRKCHEMEQEEYDQLCNGAHALAREYIEKSNFKEQYRALFEI